MISNIKFAKEIPDCNRKEGRVVWQSPSNIALIKYWGKKHPQIPCNPSLSFSLSKSVTKIDFSFSPKSADGTIDLEFYFGDEKNEMFARRIKKYFESQKEIFPFLDQFKFKVISTNTFPHSAGIASSASSFSALSLCLCSMVQMLGIGFLEEESDFYRHASFFARLGSGSACRSVFGGVVTWGEYAGRLNSSNLFASQAKEIDHNFSSFRDSILIVDRGAKKISSSEGHSLMEGHPYALSRYGQAQENFRQLLSALRNNNLKEFGSILEIEALSIHSMMMTSNPSFFLFKPQTIELINRIRKFREESGLPLYFTLDAGPNLHLLYPDKNRGPVRSFIEGQCLEFLSGNQWIDDQVGDGPRKLILEF